jgi:diguanylate cyclase (GGDEF)-like protein/PAS domain S-box-containing protein
MNNPEKQMKILLAFLVLSAIGLLIIEDIQLKVGLFILLLGLVFGIKKAAERLLLTCGRKNNQTNSPVHLEGDFCEPFKETLDKRIQYNDIFHEATQLIAILSDEGLLLDANKAVLDLGGLKLAEILNKPFWELSCWIHSEQMQNKILFTIEESALLESEVRFEAQYRDFSGQIIDLDFIIRPVFDALNQVRYYIAMGYNVSELVTARKSLSDKERQMLALFRYSKEGLLFNMMPEPILIDHSLSRTYIDELIKYQVITRANAAADALYKRDTRGMKIYEILQMKGKAFRALWRDLLERGFLDFERRIVLDDGSIKDFEFTLVSIQSEDKFYGNFASVRDITKQRAYEAELEFLANKDALTGLNNRRTFFKYSEKSFQNADQPLCIIIFDIDHFKKVNDTYGHMVGDQVLKGLASFLMTFETREHVVSRFGGEEFIMMITGEDSEEPWFLAEKLRSGVESLRFTLEDGLQIAVTISIGLTCQLPSDMSLDQVMVRADEALYKAKQSGRNRVEKG